MKKLRVLFICIHNSARSQMAEAFLNTLGGERFEAQSAGLEAGTLNPVVVDVMKDVGIDISANKTKQVMDFYKRGEHFDYVIAVCDAASKERCPIFPGAKQMLHWAFPDPSALSGSAEEKRAETRKIRDMIKTAVEEFIRSVG